MKTIAYYSMNVLSNVTQLSDYIENYMLFELKIVYCDQFRSLSTKSDTQRAVTQKGTSDPEGYKIDIKTIACYLMNVLLNVTKGSDFN